MRPILGDVGHASANQAEYLPGGGLTSGSFTQHRPAMQTYAPAGCWAQGGNDLR